MSGPVALILSRISSEARMGRRGNGRRREKNERAPSSPHLHSNYANIGQIARRVNRLDDRFESSASLLLALCIMRCVFFFFPFFFFCTRRPRFSDDPIFIYYAVRSRKRFTTRLQTRLLDNARGPPVLIGETRVIHRNGSGILVDGLFVEWRSLSFDCRTYVD